VFAYARWAAWETWSWYRHFCRLYAPYLRAYANTLGASAFGALEGREDAQATLVRRWWSVAILEA
jgi:nuclear cap-binding protein subunit 1